MTTIFIILSLIVVLYLSLNFISTKKAVRSEMSHSLNNTSMVLESIMFQSLDPLINTTDELGSFLKNQGKEVSIKLVNLREEVENLRIDVANHKAELLNKVSEIDQLISRRTRALDRIEKSCQTKRDEKESN